MAAGDRKPRSGQRRATETVAFRLLPAQAAALARLAQRNGTLSPSTQARDIVLSHLDQPEAAAARLALARQTFLQIRARCITLTGPHTPADRQQILGEIVRMIDGRQA